MRGFLGTSYCWFICPQASRTVINSADITFQMLEDWRNVDLNSITKQTLYTMEDSQEEHRQLIIHCKHTQLNWFHSSHAQMTLNVHINNTTRGEGGGYHSHDQQSQSINDGDQKVKQVHSPLKHPGERLRFTAASLLWISPDRITGHGHVEADAWRCCLHPKLRKM